MGVLGGAGVNAPQARESKPSILLGSLRRLSDAVEALSDLKDELNGAPTPDRGKPVTAQTPGFAEVYETAPKQIDDQVAAIRELTGQLRGLLI